jgi:hypothetical protein
MSCEARILFADPFYWSEMELDDWVKVFCLLCFEVLSYLIYLMWCLLICNRICEMILVIILE